MTLAARLAKELEQGWLSKARPAQLPPEGDWSIWLLLGGRGYGKSLAAAQYVRSMIESGDAKSVAICGSTMSDIRDVCIEGPSGLLAISPDWNRPVYEPSKRRLTYPNGATATLFSAEEFDRLRGPNHDLAWCDELASWANQMQTWDMLQMTLRVGEHPRAVISTTPKPSKLLKSLIDRAKPDGLGRQDVVITGGSTYDNRANLAPNFFHSITRRYEGTRIGKQELLAEYLEDVPGALWNRAQIDELRRTKNQLPEFTRIVVAIDPSIGGCSEDSDECGLIVAAIGADGHGFILEDASGRFLPDQWARRAVALYHKYSADRIVIEVNQGGQMAESTLRAVDRNVPIRSVHATKGKLIRAEPISALYEQGRIHHVGAFPALEDQMTSYDGSGNSPDRLDAMVYALTELLAGKKSTGIIEYYKDLVEQDRANGTAFGLPARPQLAAATVCLVAPGDCNTLFTLSGRKIDVGEDRLVRVSERDATSLKQAGWAEVEHVHP